MKIRNVTGDTRNLPATLWWRDVSLPRTVPSAKLRGRDGAVPVGGNSLEPREFEITGTLQADQQYPMAERKKRLVQTLDDLKGFMLQGPVEVTRSDQDDRILFAELMDVQERWQNGYDWLEVAFSMRADDPYWYSWKQSEDAVELTSGQIHTLYTVGGNAPIFPTIRLTGRIGTVNPALANLDSTTVIQYVGTLANGKRLVIDTKRSHATLDEVGVVNKMTPLPFFWTLKPGRNKIKYIGSGTVGFYINWRERSL